MSIFFISGIDTDIGKTYATGALARELLQNAEASNNSKSVITQKLVQTGCDGISEDILCHRQIMGLPLQEVDKQGLTCPYVFTKPASPHLSSVIENTVIDPSVITHATDRISTQYDIVLLEGAGGLMVPITDSLLTIDYVAEQAYPVILVTSGRLGSINHTLLSIEALKQRHIPLHAIIYNHWQPDNDDIVYKKDDEIVDNTRQYLLNYLKINHPQAYWVDLPNSARNQSQSFDNSYSLTKYAISLL